MAEVISMVKFTHVEFAMEIMSGRRCTKLKNMDWADAFLSFGIIAGGTFGGFWAKGGTSEIQWDPDSSQTPILQI